jgi:hypothetical protein
VSGQVKLLEHSYSSDELFLLGERDPWGKNPWWANQTFKKNITEIPGPGIYAVFYQENLIYIGKFLGTKVSPFNGDIVGTRWDKHIGSFTMRGYQVSVRNRTLIRTLTLPRCAISDGLRCAKQDMILDRGMVAGFNRVKFAIKHWDKFCRLSQEMLSSFVFYYLKIGEMETDPTNLRKRISLSETALIECFRPCCNGGSEDGISQSDTPERVLGKIRETLESAFENLDYICLDQIGKRAKVGSSEQLEAIQFNDKDDDVEGFEGAFLSRLNDAGAAFVRNFRSSMEDGFELYFTGTRGGDLRVRTRSPKSPGRTLMTMKWLKLSKTFCCETLASGQNCMSSGFTKEQIEKSSDKIMMTRLTFSPRETNESSLCQVLEFAHDSVCSR